MVKKSHGETQSPSKALGGGFHIFPLSKQLHDRKSFSCGNPELDRFLQEQAMQDRTRNISTTYVLIHEQSPSEIIGYYTLIPCQVFAPPDSRLKNYLHPLSAMKLGRLAIDEQFQGNRLSQGLILHAIDSTVQVSNIAGGIGLFVDPKDAELVTYYRKWGFLPIELDGEGISMWLPIEMCRQTCL